ncbi:MULTISPECIES: Sec-independent protein translocase subunit TatA [Pantoea]|uniref:Sec-independent protein translocase protein TatA n=1 Tax=Candidatus Pantoea multigeneris TaxID=2608357 RepID=A0ABX0RGR0_9GAMM|nr:MULTISPECIES: Sec-independent protein translocase subunit TatA [Pantoea]NIF24515.1 twin-arginine translocase subunit TatA [Pantoea multigeneris]
MGGISIGKLLIVAVIIVLIFGTKKFRTLGADLGASLKGFKKAMSDDDKKEEPAQQDADFATKTLPEQQQTAAKKEEARNDKQV